MDSVHEPVLLHEIVEMFAILAYRIPDLVYLDGTLGGAGHASTIAKTFDGRLTVVGLDRDMNAINRAKKLLQGKADRIILDNYDYRNMDEVLSKNKISGIDIFLLDLGISSDELDCSGKGFSFQRDEPLLMTMGNPEKYPFTASTIVNEWDEEVVANIIFGYGEERFARRIARSICSYRSKKTIESSIELAEIISTAVPAFYRRGKINPATKTFQALRIAVNDELNALKEGLMKGYQYLNKNGRMAVISFHSLEDRIVKNFYKDRLADGSKIITKKPITASDQEKAENPRSRSAKLRVLEK